MDFLLFPNSKTSKCRGSMAQIMAVANGNNTWETAASRMFAAVLQFGMREYEQAEAFGSADVRALR